MARPYKLIKREVLEAVYKDRTKGVKYNTLLKNYSLVISGPVLKRLVEFYEKYLTLESEELAEYVENSLFPSWLNDDPAKVQTQPQGWKYEGLMPYGRWVHESE